MEDLSELKRAKRKRGRLRQRIKQVSVILLISTWVVIVCVFVALQVISNGANALMTLSRLEWLLGNRDSAISHLWMAVQRNPDTETLSKYVEAMRLAGRLKEVDSQLASLPSSSSYDEIAKARVIVFIEQLDLISAEKLCNEWIAKSPKSADAFLMRGRVNEELKEYGKAQSDYLKSISLLQCAAAVDGLARVRQRLLWTDNTYTEMMEFKFRGDPNNPKDKLSHALRLCMADDYDSALKIYSDLIERKQLLPAAYLGRGGVYGRLGRSKEAIADLDLAIKLIPEASPTGMLEYTQFKLLNTDGQQIYTTRLDLAYANRAQCLLQLNRCEEALVDINKAIALKPQSLQFKIRSQILYKLGKFEAAKKDENEIKIRGARHQKSVGANDRAQSLFYLMAE